MLFKEMFSCLLIIFVTASCATINLKTHFNEGEYELVINKLHQRSSTGILKDKEVIILQNSVERLLFKKKFALTRKLHSEHFGVLKSAYVSLDLIEEIQNKVKLYEQLDKKYLGLIDIEKWDDKFSDKLYEHHVEQFEKHEKEFLENKNQNHLIKAHGELAKLAHFNRGEINTDSLMRLFAKYGKRKMNIEFIDNPIYSSKINLLKDNIKPENSSWTTFGNFSNSDFTINIELIDINTSCNVISEDVHTVINEMLDSFNSGTYKSYQAKVNDVQYNFIARARVRVEIFSNREDILVTSKIFRKSWKREVWKRYFVEGDRGAYFRDSRTNKSTPFMDKNNFDYEYLTEKSLEAVSFYISNYLENY